MRFQARPQRVAGRRPSGMLRSGLGESDDEVAQRLDGGAVGDAIDARRAEVALEGGDDILGALVEARR